MVTNIFALWCLYYCPYSERWINNSHTRVFSLFSSETVKFGHVTFFWNGNRSGYFDASLEEYVEIPSDSGITFNVKPNMKALEIAEKTRDAILSGKFDQVEICLGLGESLYIYWMFF